jgi:hypothetical protein
LEVCGRQYLLRHTNRGATHREEEVAYVMRDEDAQTHVREVEAVAQEDQGQRDDVVADQLLEVLARLLHAQQQHDGLLGPVGGLEEVVELEGGVVRAVREALVHGARVEVPQRRAAHHPQPPRARDAEVDGRVHLLHEPRLLGPALEPAAPRQRPEEALHDELAREREHDDVEGHEGNVPPALAVLDRRIGGRVGRRRQRVREEEEAVHGVRGRRIDGVEGEERPEQRQRRHPGVLHRVPLPLLEQRAGLAPLGEGPLAVSLVFCLWVVEGAQVSQVPLIVRGSLLLVPLLLQSSSSSALTLIDRGD